MSLCTKMSREKPTPGMKHRHLKLISDLSTHINPSVDQHEYDQLENMLRSELPPLDRKNAKNIMDMLKKMEERGKIGVGKYDVIKTQLRGFKEDMIELIEGAEEEIERMRQTSVSGDSGNRTATSSDATHGRRSFENIYQRDPDESAEKRKPNQEETEQVKKPKRDLADPIHKSRYSQEKSQRGYIVILNFNEKRPGAYTDVKKMEEFFTDINWFVEIKQDLTREDLDKYLRSLQQSFDDKRFASQYYAFCLTLMSHGNEKGIQTDDGEYYPLDDIVKFFKNDRMPNFAGKPKFFLIQACRGGGEQEAVNLPDDRSVDISDYVGKLSVPTDSDILMAYATTPGYKSYRLVDGYTGSWFLNEVLEVFEENSKTEHVEEMLINVRENVASKPRYATYNNREGTDDGTRQMPCCWTTLTKRLYLQ